MKTEWRAKKDSGNRRGWSVYEYDSPTDTRAVRLVVGGIEEADARRIATLPELEAIVAKLDKTADGVLITDGMACYVPCVNGTLCFYAYLSPQSEPTEAYPWGRSYSTPEAAEAAREETGS